MSLYYKILLMHHLVMGMFGDLEWVSTLASVGQVKG
jgi:hypothetical protein